MIQQLQSVLSEIIEPYAGDREEELLDTFSRFVELLRQRTREANLTAIRDPNEIAIHVVGDALAPMQNAPKDYLSSPPSELLDVGSGAGIPGLVYAIMWPKTQVVLLESQKKRIEFLRDAVEELELQNVEVLEGRAESHAHELHWRERFELVTSRAVAPLPISLELSLPFLALEGYYLTFKGPNPSDEVKEAEFALNKLGGGSIEVRSYVPGPSATKRTALWSEKIGLTPDRFPRKEGIPAKRPLRGSR
ncbi:16S rRNA (guanine(527)-N(7))-methyltransferase RsmG [Candidatus Sumerlaeota bacterium]|nr:16S rRNA (guanine(527)-N(7))-methyltransferase RsmG [Candidatus Sumerlaeota bacterium]HMZ50680.1 16S rRNA (guanine(527)-N(7))-methyltransferase RsmG [Candidatus Sumerlaeota bacterium]HNM45633.1 16S rRNA (guanine(527)-N(7))-methyltransferase RsmG [Candidatus Sumerlaeota bacterium]